MVKKKNKKKVSKESQQKKSESNKKNDFQLDQVLFKSEQFNLNYYSFEQSIIFDGLFRVTSLEEGQYFIDLLLDAYQSLNSNLVLDFKKLRYINSLGCVCLFYFFQKVQALDEKKKIKVVVTKILDKGMKSLKSFIQLVNSSNIEYHVYDENFYEGQKMVEAEDFVDLLRTQTKIIWPQERKLLEGHGLKRGMKVIDICCGVGDFVFNIAKEFSPSFIVGVDHSSPSINYARKVAKNLNFRNVDFLIGDATSLNFKDNEFDFVSCRLSLQIFSEPELIVKELYRILKPGGTLYIVNEDYDLMLTSHHAESTRDLYSILYDLSLNNMKMDFHIGRKAYSFLSQYNLEDIKISMINVDTNNSKKVDYIKVVKGWKDFFVSAEREKDLFDNKKETYTIADKLFDKHIGAIEHPYGYSCWPLIAGSGRKK